MDRCHEIGIEIPMDGKYIYGLYESGGACLQTVWEHLSNEDRSRWEYVAHEIWMRIMLGDED